MRAARWLLGLVGVGLAAFGARELIGLGFDNLLATLIWLGGGVIAHDAILAPATIAVAAVAARVFGGKAPGPVIIGALVLGTVTIAVIPMLGAFGARDDNATLLDRDYLAGWAGFAILTAVAVAAALLWPRGKGGR